MLVLVYKYKLYNAQIFLENAISDAKIRIWEIEIMFSGNKSKSRLSETCRIYTILDVSTELILFDWGLSRIWIVWLIDVAFITS